MIRSEQEKGRRELSEEKRRKIRENSMNIMRASVLEVDGLVHLNQRSNALASNQIVAEIQAQILTGRLMQWRQAFDIHDKNKREENRNER
jgi:hypothetical protein